MQRMTWISGKSSTYDFNCVSPDSELSWPPRRRPQRRLTLRSTTRDATHLLLHFYALLGYAIRNIIFEVFLLGAPSQTSGLRCPCPWTGPFQPGCAFG